MTRLETKRPGGIQFLAIWHALVAAFFFACTALLHLVWFWMAVSSDFGSNGDISAGQLIIVLVASGVLFLIGLAYAVVGWGVWRMRPWSRIPALILAVLGLGEVPIGTVAGCLTLWYLIREEGGGRVLVSGPKASEKHDRTSGGDIVPAS